MGLFSPDFKKCPHFSRRHDDVKKIKKLEEGHKEILKELLQMRGSDEEQNSYLKKHMEDELVQHKSVNETLVSLNSAVTTLIDDKVERDTLADKREKIRDKILSSVAIVVIIGIGKVLLDMYATTKVLGIE